MPDTGTSGIGAATRAVPRRPGSQIADIRPSTSATVTTVGWADRIISPSWASAADKIARTICGTPVHHASAASTSLTRRSCDAAGPDVDGGALTSTQTQSSSVPSRCTVTVVTHSPRSAAEELSASRYRSEREPSRGCSSVTTSWACSATSWTPGATVTELYPLSASHERKCSAVSRTASWSRRSQKIDRYPTAIQIPMTSRSPTRRRRLDHYGIATPDGWNVRPVIELLFNLLGFLSALRSREEPGKGCWCQRVPETGSDSRSVTSWSASVTAWPGVWPRWKAPKS